MSTRISKADRAQSVAQLREWVKPGDTVYCILRHVARSGMSRDITPFVTIDGRMDDRRY
jgi:hypothetical protein